MGLWSKLGNWRWYITIDSAPDSIWVFLVFPPMPLFLFQNLFQDCISIFPSPFLNRSHWHTQLYFFVLISYHAHTNILFHMNDIITHPHTHTHHPPGSFYSTMCLETFWNATHPLLTHGDKMLVHLSVTECEAAGRARSCSRHTLYTLRAPAEQGCQEQNKGKPDELFLGKGLDIFSKRTKIVTAGKIRTSWDVFTLVWPFGTVFILHFIWGSGS